MRLSAEEAKQVKDILFGIDVYLGNARRPPTLGVECPSRIADDIACAQKLIGKLEFILLHKEAAA